MTDAGSYCGQAVDSGDGNHNGITSKCTDEQVVVSPNSPSIGTTLSETSGSIGDTVHDSSKLTGATSNAGGTVTYTVYSDSSCSTLFADAGAKRFGGAPPGNPVSGQSNVPSSACRQAVFRGDGH